MVVLGIVIGAIVVVAAVVMAAVVLSEAGSMAADEADLELEDPRRPLEATRSGRDRD